MDKIVVISHDPLSVLWGIGWLFTIGFLRLSFGKGLLAIIVWPFYLGRHFTGKHLD